MKRRIISVLTAAFVGFSTAGAQQSAFHSNLLKDIGKAIAYTPIDTLKAGVYPAGTVLGKPLIAEYDSRHIVTNLGFRLFSQEQKLAYSSDIYNFLERYFLELYVWKDKTTLQQKIKDDKVLFTKGTIANLKDINEGTPYQISRTEDKFYEVTWKDASDNDILSVAFPIQYELLLGMPQEEIARTMFDRIVGAPAHTGPMDSCSIEKVKDDIYESRPKKFYQLESCNNTRYMMKQDNGDYALIIDPAHADYSVTNIFHESTYCNNPMKVEQSVYGFNTLEYTITLQQWMNYCKDAALTTYTAIEEEYDDAFKVLVVAENKDMGYNHLLSAIVPRDFITKPNAVINCKLNAFIPTHNVKNLYQQYKEKPKKKF